MKFLVSLPWIQGGLKTGWLHLDPAVASLPLPQLAWGAIFEETFPYINLTHLWFLVLPGFDHLSLCIDLLAGDENSEP